MYNRKRVGPKTETWATAVLELYCEDLSCRTTGKQPNNITIMFILRALLSFEARGFWFAAWQCHFTNRGWQTNSKGLKWQQYQNEWTLLLLLLMSYGYTNAGHYAMCNRENMKTLQCFHLVTSLQCLDVFDNQKMKTLWWSSGQKYH